MRSCIVLVVATGVLAAVPGPTEAQETRVNFSLGAGLTAPNSEVRDHLGDGYNVSVGLQVNLTPVIAIEGLYSFNGLGDKDITVPLYPAPQESDPVQTNLSAGMNMQYGTASLVVRAPEGKARPYGLAGMGVYYRPIEVTTPAAGWIPGYCDPWWYVCYAGGWVETERIVGERSSTDFGMTLGGGLTFGRVFAEFRYHYIWGPEVPDQVPVQPLPGATAPSTRKASGQFLATTFGFRF